MKKIYGFLLSVCFGVSALNAGYDISKDEMMNYVDSVKALFQSRYAPSEWKREYCQWDLEKEINELKQSLEKEDKPTVKSFQRQLRRFLYSTKDYHVSAMFFSTESAFLPFQAKKFGDRYYITYVDETKLNVFKPGDELVGFGGEAPEAVVARLKIHATPSASLGSDQSLAEKCLTMRMGVVGHEVPRGPITIAAKDRDSDELKSYQLIWTYTPEIIADHAVAQSNVPTWPMCLDPERMNRSRALPLVEHYLSACSEENEENYTRDPNELGAKISFLPKLGRVEWESPSTSSIHSYLYENDEGMMVGYLRIPHFTLLPEDMADIEQNIKLLRENAEVLVIDQLNNPGGSLFAAYGIASMLTDTPLETPKEHLLLSQEDVMEACFLLDLLDNVQSDEEAQLILGESFIGAAVNYQIVQFIKEYSRFIIDQWKQGRIYTDLTFLYGIDHINPHPEARFVKPIVLLTNELDFSCGDFFPAIMKDNNRATLVGTPTAGAGGFVLRHRTANKLGVIRITLTGSLGIRSNGDPIENLGVSPHVDNKLTPADVKNGYQDYARKINEIVKEKGNL